MREALWLRRRLHRPDFWDPERPHLFVHAPPVEYRPDEFTCVCTRAAPVIRRERSRPEGWRLAPRVQTAQFASGAEGEDTEHSDFLGGDLASDGVEPAARDRRAPATRRKGLPRFDYNGNVILMDVRTVMVPGPDGELLARPVKPPASTWQETLMDAVRDAKARVLEFEANGGPNPRKPGRSAHPEAVLANVGAPTWVTPGIVNYLIEAVSWESGGCWQISSSKLTKWLRTRESFARAALAHLENVAVSHFDDARGADNEHAADTLVRAHALVDAVLGRKRRKPADALRAREAELGNVADPAKQAARLKLRRLYNAAIVPLEPPRTDERKTELLREELWQIFFEAQRR